MCACSVEQSALGASRALVLGLVAGLLFAAPVAVQGEDASGVVDDMLREAQTEMSKGRPREATIILGKAIALSPNRAELHILRSRAHDSSGKFEAALKDATRYIELEPNDAYGYLNRARVYMSLDKLEPALADANKAIELEPEEPDGYYRRADIYVQLGKKPEAQADEVKAEELDKLLR